MNENWTLAEWLDYLENRHSVEVQLRLVNVDCVAKIMNVQAWDIPVITVAGTNGKGSTVAALSAIYQSAGYRVGQFTSPHVLHFNERICVNQQPIEDDALCQLFHQIEMARGDTGLTYFEMSFLAALLYFKNAGLDLMILEVGVGGRLDATNCIDADLAIITTVDLDHQDYLGPDKESIGTEKAGILRSEQCFIYADIDPPQSVMAKALALETDTYCLGKTYQYHVRDGVLSIQQSFQETIVLPVPHLHPNAAVAAIMASLCLQTRLPVTEKDWINAMHSRRIMGRQQHIPGNISFVYDVAHNPQAVTALVQYLQDNPARGTLHAVFSALKDKDICGLIKPLSSIVGQWYPVCLTGKRASSQEQLLAAFGDALDTIPHCYSDPLQATAAAVAAAKSGDLIVVYGSFILVGAVMAVYHHPLIPETLS